MSATLLNRFFGLQGCQYVKTMYHGPEAHFHICDPRPQCAACSSENVVRDESKSRVFRSLAIGRKPSFAVLDIPRLQCRGCGVKRQARIRFADPMKTYTRSFQRLALELLELGTVQSVAHFLGIGWDLVKRIQKEHLRKQCAKPPLKKVTAIAIDEFHLGLK